MRFRYSFRKLAKPFVNSGDPDQMQHSAASDVCLHCLPITLLGISRLQWVNRVFALFLLPKSIYTFSASAQKHIGDTQKCRAKVLLMNTHIVCVHAEIRPNILNPCPAGTVYILSLQTV